MGKAIGAVASGIGGKFGGILGGLAGGAVGGALSGGGGLGTPSISDKSAFDLEKESKRNIEMYNRDLNRNAGADAAARGSGTRLLTQLEQQAQGRAPSIAEAQMRQTSDRNLAQQLAAAQAARGGNLAAQQRQLTQAQGAAGRQLAQDSAIARLQERNQAQQMLGQQALGQQQISGARVTGAMGEIADARLMPKQSRQQAALAELGVNTQINLARRGERQGLIGGALGGVAAAIPFLSDESKKKDIKTAKGSTFKFLDALSAKQFKYKDDTKLGTAPGKRYGIMAQDLEKSDMGKSLVMDTPQGKMIDGGQTLGALLAANADMHKRIKKLEGKGKA